MDSTAAGAAAAAGPPHDQPHDQPAPQPVLSFVGHRRRLPPDAELFEEGSLARDEAARGAARAAAHDEPAHLAQEGALAGDPLMAAFLCHEHECGTCHATLPTPHLLGLHVAEVHDSFFAAQAARRLPVFACLVEACGRRFCGAEERKQHLVDHHRFPRNYSFDRMHLRRALGGRGACSAQNPAARPSTACAFWTWGRGWHTPCPLSLLAGGRRPRCGSGRSTASRRHSGRGTARRRRPWTPRDPLQAAAASRRRTHPRMRMWCTACLA